MAQSTISPASPKKMPARLKPYLLGALALIIFWLMVYWGGMPPRRELPFFIVGVTVFMVAVAGFAYAYWYLLLKPLPAGHRVPQEDALPVTTRQLMAALVGLTGTILVVGAFWDEVWHRSYGIPFGEDLFWRPHLMMYLSFTLISLMAFGGLVYLLRRGQGTLQQRFRSSPVVGTMVVLSGFLLFSVPADPLWHTIYGEDITAWSLPHLVLVLSFVGLMVMAVAIQLSTMRQREWAPIWRGNGADFFITGVMTFALVVGLQVMTTEWDAPVAGNFSAAFLSRPIWIFPAMVAIIAVFLGILANQSTRRYGMATLTGLLAFGVRYGLIQLFNYNEMTARNWLLALPPLLAIDLWYAWRGAKVRQPANWIGAGLAAAVATIAISLPLMNRLFATPQVNAGNLLSFIFWITLLSLGSSWIATNVGEYLGTANKHLTETTATDRRLQLVPPVAFVVVLSFIILFVVTATPPA